MNELAARELVSMEIAIDFTRLDDVHAVRHVQQLRALGLGDHAIAALVAWNVGDVRRAIGYRTWMRP